MRNLFKPNRCPHINVLPIYGDFINKCGGYRLRCNDCFRFLDGPVSVAIDRQRIVDEKRGSISKQINQET